VNQYSGTHPNPQAIHNLFLPTRKTAQDAAQRTGLNAGTIKDAAHPSSPGFESAPNWYRCSESQGGANPVLNAFWMPTEMVMSILLMRCRWLVAI